MFSCMDMYGQRQTPELLASKEKFKKTSRRKQTLVFEMVGTFVNFLDPASSEFNL